MSTIKTNTLTNLAGTKSVPVDTVVDGSAKAWVNFNGTGTVEIRASFNVSSITDNGTGDYTINFINPMPDANYVIDACADDSSSTDRPLIAGPINVFPPTATSCRIVLMNPANTRRDGAYVSVKITR